MSIEFLKLLNWLNNDEFGQIFITDTHSERIKKILEQSNKSYQIYNM